MHKAVLAAVAAVLPLAAMAGEERVELTSQGQPLIGTLRLPEGAPAPVVLMLHGFTGTRDELATEAVPEGVFARTAAALEDKGFASLRIDMRGSGESLADMSYAETTFETQIADALAALDWLSGSGRVAGEDVYLIGWSQGGLVAAAAAGRSGLPDAVALWNAVGDTKATYGGILGSETMAAGMAAAPGQAVTATLPWGAEVVLNGAFFDGIENHDATAEIAAYTGPLLVAQGSADTTVLPENADAYLAAHEGPEELYTAPMDHSFNIFVDDAELTRLIDRTIGFFRSHDD